MLHVHVHVDTQKDAGMAWFVHVRVRSTMAIHPLDSETTKQGLYSKAYQAFL